MASEKTIAIVTRLVEFSETSLIVTLMTKDFGKITAMAKGARRHKSPFESALDLLAECRIVFIKKSSGAMSLLTEAKLERRFRSSATSLNRLYAGYFVIEMINALTDEGDPHPDLFESAKNFICKIDSPNYADSNLRLDLLKFEIELLISLGHKPMLGYCVGCGREKTEVSRVYFGLSDGGIYCSNCRRGKRNIVSLSGEGLQFLLALAGEKIGNHELQPLPLSSASPTHVGFEESWALVQKYLTHLLGFPPKLAKFLKQLP